MTTINLGALDSLEIALAETADVLMLRIDDTGQSDNWKEALQAYKIAKSRKDEHYAAVALRRARGLPAEPEDADAFAKLLYDWRAAAALLLVQKPFHLYQVMELCTVAADVAAQRDLDPDSLDAMLEYDFVAAIHRALAGIDNRMTDAWRGLSGVFVKAQEAA